MRWGRVVQYTSILFTVLYDEECIYFICNLWIAVSVTISSSPSLPLFVSLPPAEFSRESLEAAGGLECPLSKEKEDCSSVANVADPSSKQNNAQAGTEKLKKTGTGTQESFPWGTLHHRFTRQGLFKNVKQFNRLGLVSCNHGSSTNICEVPLIHTSHSAAVAEMPWEAATSESGKISLGLFCHYCRLSLLILFVSYVLISFSSLSLSIYRMWTY